MAVTFTFVLFMCVFSFAAESLYSVLTSEIRIEHFQFFIHVSNWEVTW